MHKLLYTTNIRFLERTPTKEASFRDFDCKQKFYLSPWSQSILRSEYTCMRWWRSVCIICGGGGASTTFGRHVARHTCVWFAPKRTEKKHCVVAKENMCLRPRPGCTYMYCILSSLVSVRPTVCLPVRSYCFCVLSGLRMPLRLPQKYNMMHATKTFRLYTVSICGHFANKTKAEKEGTALLRSATNHI